MKKALMYLTLIFLHVGVAFAQDRLTGVVRNAEGVGLTGVTITEEGQSANSVASSGDGTFQITVAKRPTTLLFSMVGYDTQRVQVRDADALTVTLHAAQEHLEEVVVTGYSSQRREQITASVATVSADDIKKNPASPNVANMLQGKVAGVDVTLPSGRPGAAPQVRIRGRSSISSQTGALWVIDGVIIHGDPNINPSDIESMSVLKDGAATSQYGSRGVNGVIVVTTKQAKEIGVSRLSANLRTGVSYFNSDNFKLMNGRELLDVFSQFANQDAVPDIPASVVDDDFDWVKNGTQGGRLNDLNLSYSGKSEKASVYAAGNYYSEEGSVKGLKFDRFSGRLNVNYEVNKRLTLRPKINITYRSGDNQEHSLYQMYLNMPWDNPYAADGSVYNPRRDDGLTWYGRDGSNYLYDLQYNYGQSHIFDFQSNIDFDYKIDDHFTFVSSNSVAYYSSDGRSYVDPQSDAGQADNGRISRSSAKRIVRFTNQMLRYNNNWGPHSLNAFAAYEFNDYHYQDMSATGKGIVPGTSILDVASEPQSVGGGENEYAFQSGMVQAEYGFHNRYNFQASVRRDGSSRFGQEKRYGTFYAVSGAWNIHNEAFFQSNAVDFLRLRASYGQIGNVPTAYYASYSLFNLNQQYAGIPGGVMGQLGNSMVSWETSKDFNVGLEAGLFHRVSTTIEWYHKNTDGLLQYITLPSTAGWAGYYDNIGSVRNQGVEVTLGGDIFAASSPFQWRLDVNAGFNRNKITSLFNDQDIPAGKMRRSVGRDIDTYYMRKWAGVNPENGDPQWEVVDPSTGEVTLTNNFNQATLQYLDQTGTPNVQGGLTTAMQYKGFYLNAALAFTEGAWAYNASRQYFDADGAYPYYNQMALMDGWSRWTPDNPHATHPVMNYNNQNNSNGVSSRYLEDASLVRLRNVTLGYRLPSTWLQQWHVSNIDVFISGDNVWSKTKFSTIDPEGTLSASTGRGGDDTSQYPVPKRFLFGINVSF